jgi:hypothetical protein
MMLLRRIPALFLLLLAVAATALASPKGKKHRAKGHPKADCKVENAKNGIRDIYTLYGNNWNVTEAQLKAGLETPGTVVTGWEFKEAINVDDIHTFKAKVGHYRCRCRCRMLICLLDSGGCRFMRSRRLRRNWRGWLSRSSLRLSVKDETTGREVMCEWIVRGLVV